jgi:hypothetical protein
MTDVVSRPVPEGKINSRNFVTELRRAVPDFKPDDWAEGLSYPTANELIRFVVAYQPVIDTPNVVSAFQFFEKALLDGDPEVFQVVWDAYEGLSNDDLKLYSPLLGSASTELAIRIARERS